MRKNDRCRIKLGMTRVILIRQEKSVKKALFINRAFELQRDDEAYYLSRVIFMVLEASLVLTV